MSGFIWNNLPKQCQKNIVVFGDGMLDINYYGRYNKLANEAPVPVFQQLSKTVDSGGVLNVYRNLTHLYPESNIYLFTVVGADKYGQQLQSKHPQIVTDSSRLTTIKKRYYIGNRLVFRNDIEVTNECSGEIQHKLLANVLQLFETVEISTMIISDYGKGVCSKYACETLLQYAEKYNCFTIVDPKPDYSKYKRCNCIKINEIEALQYGKQHGIQATDTELYDIAKHIQITLCIPLVIITQSSKGCIVINKCASAALPIPVIRGSNIVAQDVIGAGDVVSTLLGYWYTVHAPQTFTDIDNLKEMMDFNLLVASGSVSNFGSSSIEKLPLYKYLCAYYGNICSSQMLDWIVSWIRKNDPAIRIGLTNGCFDLFHEGHLHIINTAKCKCDFLIVAVNSDASVRVNKGAKRPKHNERTRAAKIALMQISDCVTVFDDATPIKLLELIKPDIMFKGGDYTPNNVIGKEHCKVVEIISYLPGHSTTRILEDNIYV